MKTLMKESFSIEGFRKCKGSIRRGGAGFTLVELMVVIVIVAVLASLGFMGASKLLRKSREAAAVSNMRQLSQGLFAIQSDGGALARDKMRGSYPAEAGYSSTGRLYTWIYEVAEQLGYGEYDKDTWGANFRWTTDPNATAFHDPTADWEIEDTGVPNSRMPGTIWQTAHFGYNSQLGSFVNPWVPSFEKGEGSYEGDREALVSQTRKPSSLILLAQSAGAGKISNEEASLDGHVPTDQSMLIWPWRKKGSTATRTRGGAQCVFADGHVDWVNTAKLYEGSWDSPNLVPDSRAARKSVN